MERLVQYEQQTQSFGVVYRPPSIPYGELQFLTDILNKVIIYFNICLCAGGFNINYLYQASADFRFFQDILSSFNFNQTVEDPTQITPNNEPLLDLTYVNRPKLMIDSGM